MAMYSAGSASVNIVPDFSGAQRKIGQWFAGQKDVKVGVSPDLNNAKMAAVRAQVSGKHAILHVDIDRKKLAHDMVGALDFLTGTSMVQKALRSIFDVKPILYSQIGGAGTLIAAALSQASGVASLLPASLAAAALPMATLVTGSQGLVDAFKALGSGDAKKVAAAMKGLSDNAKDFVVQTHALGKAWKDVRFDVQDRLFAGLGDKMSILGNKVMPVLKRGLGGLADEFNFMAKDVADLLSSDGNLADFGHVFDNVKKILHEVVLAARPLLQAFFDLTTVGSDMLVPLVSGFGDLAQNFADFIREARNSGALEKFMSNAMSALGDVLTIVINLGKAIGSIFNVAMPYAKAFLDILKGLTGDLATFLKTAEARSGLGDFFSGIVETASTLAPALLDIAEALFTGVLPAMSGFAKSVAPVVAGVLSQFADLLKELAPLFYPALADAVASALGALAPLIDVFSEIAKTVLPALIDAINKLAPLFAELAEGVGEALTQALEKVSSLLPKIVDAIEAVAEALVPMILGVVNFAVDVLPPLVAVLGFVARALEKLAPLLPMVLASFLAYKAIKGLNSILTGFSSSLATLSQNLAFATYKTPALAGAAGVAQKGIGGLRGAIGGLAGFLTGGWGLAIGAGIAGFALIQTAAAKADKEIADATDELTKLRLTATLPGKAGKDAADELRGKYEEVRRLQHEVDTFEVPKGTVSGEIAVEDVESKRQELANYKQELADSKDAIVAMRRELGPLGFAQAQLTIAQENYTAALKAGDPRQQAEALSTLKSAEFDVATETAAANEQAKSQLDLMKEASDAILEAANAQLAYENQMARTQEQVGQYEQVVHSSTATDEAKAQASRDMQQSALEAAAAAGRNAEEEAKAKGVTDTHKASIDAQVATLEKFAKQLDGPARAALEQTIANLKHSQTQSSATQQQMKNLGVEIVRIPSSKTVEIKAPTADQEAALSRLGYHILHLPNGNVIVRTAEAEAAMQAFISKRRTATIRVNLERGTGYSGMGGQLQEFGAIGGVFRARAMAKGGFIPGDVARIVEPNTWRIIGDRVTDDEAFIPINSDPRSVKILGVTAEQMGYGLVPMAAGGLVQAARLVIDRLRSGGSYFEDLTWRGMPSIVGQYNGKLGDYVSNWADRQGVIKSLSKLVPAAPDMRRWERPPPGYASAARAGVKADPARRDITVNVASGGTGIAGFVNNGTVVTTDLDELARKARINTQRALAVSGL